MKYIVEYIDSKTNAFRAKEVDIVEGDNVEARAVDALKTQHGVKGFLRLHKVTPSPTKEVLS